MHSSHHRPWLASLALGATLLAQGSQNPSTALTATPAPRPATLLTDQPGTGTFWVLGATYKAAFGADGFTFIPFLGAHAPRNHPVRFALRAVRVGGQELPVAASAKASLQGNRAVLDRGTVTESYDLGLEQVEQTFTIAADRAGDVELELAIATDLTAGAASADGVRFGNDLGGVQYGTAYLVRDTGKTALGMHWSGQALHLRVPAALRGAGPVVIDPLVSTFAMTQTMVPASYPDIAYDASTDHWLVTWAQAFSQTDHDVVAELRSGNGDPIAGSFRAIEISGQDFSLPQAANLGSANRFLIAMELNQPHPTLGQYSIWGRTMDAGTPFTTGGLIQISPNSGLNQQAVAVGGDSGPGDRWTAVWVHGGLNIGAAEVLGRQIAADGTPLPTTFHVSQMQSPCVDPVISRSNGNGLTSTPRWCVAYNVQNSPTDFDVRAATIDLVGTVRSDAPVTTAASNDRYPHVSSPQVDLDGQPRFLICYEQSVPNASEMVVQLVDQNVASMFPEINLTRRYGLDGAFSRVESDGTRFVAVCKIAGALRAATLALVNQDLVLHEAMQGIASGDFPNIASKRSGGGPNTDYGIAFIGANTPPRASLALYRGHAPAGGIVRRNTYCGVNLNTAGTPALGNTVQFLLSSTGSEPSGLLLGVPTPAVAVCGNCRLGLDLTRFVLFFSAPLDLPMPTDPRLVGATLSVQGFAVGSGCGPALLRLSDTFDFTIQ